jgi:hypothetical protein
MIRKLIAIVLAVLINGAVLVWFHAWSSAAVASAAAAPRHAPAIVTLPVITVHPSAEQMRQLRESRHARLRATPDQASIGGGADCLVMPYYSFATQCDATVNG